MLSIAQMQKNLKYYKNFYTGDIDGVSGALTKKAVKRFQKEYGLAEDGIYGVNTDRKLVSIVKQCQKQIGVSSDGIIGPNTVSALKKFQKKNGLTQSGIIDSETLTMIRPDSGQTDWKKVKYFKREEFKCDCNERFCNGYPAEIDPNLIKVLERARKHYGKAMMITSGLRCKKRNSQLVGSSPVSKHMEGKAADVWITGTDANNDGLVRWFRAQREVNYSYTGFGAVHVDVK